MREIKFRAWDLEEKEMLECVSVACTRENSWITMRFKNGYVDSIQNPYVLMQYTGLKDDNNKEIYEGDVILKVSTGSMFEVYYCDKSACYRAKRQDGWHFDLQEIFPINDWKVIGNIYDMVDWDF